MATTHYQVKFTYASPGFCRRHYVSTPDKTHFCRFDDPCPDTNTRWFFTSPDGEPSHPVGDSSTISTDDGYA